MQATSIPLSALPVGALARVDRVLTVGRMRRRLLDLGLTPGASVKCLGRSPVGDPSAYLIRGAVIAIRACDSSQILVFPSPKEPPRCNPDQ